jgi:hypothetical protein
MAASHAGSFEERPARVIAVRRQAPDKGISRNRRHTDLGGSENTGNSKRHRGSAPGPRLVHIPSESSGSQRSPVGSSGRSFAQVAGAILGKQVPGQNPDKDEGGGSSPPRPTTSNDQREC